MEIDPVRSLDPYPRASEIFDAVIGSWVRDSYGMYIAKFVNRAQEATAAKVIEDRTNPNPQREDLHGKWPDCGQDSEGNLLDPTSEQMAKFHSEVHMITQKKSRDTVRDDVEDFALGFQGIKTLSHIMKYLVNCGWTVAEIKEILGTSDRGKELSKERKEAKLGWKSELYAQWRETAWDDLQRHSNFVRRAIKGAFGVNNYTYFRPDANFAGTMFINPLSIILAVKKEHRRISALYMCRNYQIKLNQVLSATLERNLREARNDPENAPQWGVHLQEGLPKAIVDDQGPRG